MVTVVFDLDGTLADTAQDLIAAANRVFRERGLGEPLDARHDRFAAFRGGRAMLRLGYDRLGPAFGVADIEAGYQPLLDHYGAALDVHTRLYPGAQAAVERILSQGYRTAICTNKPEALAELLLQRLGVRDYFGALVGADTLPVRKPDPAPLIEAVRRAGGDPGRAVLVGDTVTDRDTALAAGVPCVLVTFGPEGQAVSDLNPDALLAHFDDLEAALSPLLPLQP